MNNIKQAKAVVTIPSKCYVGYSTMLHTTNGSVVITANTLSEIITLSKSIMGCSFELNQAHIQKVAIFESNKITELMKYQRLE